MKKALWCKGDRNNHVPSSSRTLAAHAAASDAATRTEASCRRNASHLAQRARVSTDVAQIY